MTRQKTKASVSEQWKNREQRENKEQKEKNSGVKELRGQ